MNANERLGFWIVFSLIVLVALNICSLTALLVMTRERDHMIEERSDRSLDESLWACRAELRQLQKSSGVP